MIRLRAFGPTREIDALLEHLRVLTGVEVRASSGPMPSNVGPARYYLSAVLTSLGHVTGKEKS